MIRTLLSRACRVIIVNDVDGTCGECISPQSVKEAEVNHGAVATAVEWNKAIEFWDDIDNQPIAVSIRKTFDTIVVRWHVTGDPEAARVAMREVLDGTWKAVW